MFSKRLQVRIEESEWREVQRAARAHRTTVAEWVRQALRAARPRESIGGTGRKLDAVRQATRHAYPVADIDEMLADIECGYVQAAR